MTETAERPTTQSDPTQPVGPLSGVRVVELATVIMGPWATSQLGDLGADVIKVEPPRGDMTRSYSPRRHEGMGAGTLNVNRNKRSIVLDLGEADDLAAFRALLATADVFVTNLRPHALERFGLDHASVSRDFPELIHVNAQGYRSGTAQADDAAYDDVIQAVTGMVDMNRRVTGEASYLPTIIADKVAGLYIVQGVLAALLARAAGQGGQHVEVPMVDALLAFSLIDHLEAATFVPDDGEPEGEIGYRRVLNRHRRALEASDGTLCIFPVSDRNWRDFTTYAGRPDLAEESTLGALATRLANPEQVSETTTALARTHTVKEWLAHCEAHGIPAAPVLTLDEAARTDYAVEGGVLTEADHPTEGRYRLIGPAVRYDATPTRLYRHCPQLGEHTAEILAELDL